MYFYLKGKYSNCRVSIDDIDADLADRGFMGMPRKKCSFLQIVPRLYSIIDGSWKNLYLSCVILERKLGRPLRRGEDAEHKNRKTLDNRRSNLRMANRSQNQANRPRTKRSTSGYKGVSWYKRFGKWQASIQKNGKKRNLGYYFDKIEAAKAYDLAARELFGEFALLNFPEG